MIELKEVSCSFSDGFGGKGLFTAVSPLSAHFSDGGRYAIVGESGSGKTTLARMIGRPSVTLTPSTAFHSASMFASVKLPTTR